MGKSRRGVLLGAGVLAAHGLLRWNRIDRERNADSEPRTNRTPSSAPAMTVETPETTTTPLPPLSSPQTLVTFSHESARPSELQVKVRTEVPDGAKHLSIGMLSDYTVATMTGVHRQGEASYGWDGSTSLCEIEFVVDVTNETNDSFGGRDYAGTRSWIFAPAPLISIRYGNSDYPSLYASFVSPLDDRELDYVRIDSNKPLYIGETSVFLGDFESSTARLFGQEISFVMPEHVDYYGQLLTIIPHLRFASKELRIGARAEQLVVFITSDPIRAGGLRMADWEEGVDEFWVHENSSIDSPNHVWLHEYVHTRQTLSLAEEMEWFREASAEYYAARLWWEYYQSRAETAEDGINVWWRGVDVVRHLYPHEYAADVLTDQQHWSSSRTPYRKGGYVLLALDTLIDEAIPGRSLQEVFRLMNQSEEPLTYSRFLELIHRVSGIEEYKLRAWGAFYLSASSVPSPVGWWEKVEEYVKENPNGSLDERR